MNIIAEEMARRLVDCGADLGDERQVILALKEARFLSGEIVTHMDEAIEIARGKGLPLSEIIGSSVAGVFGIAVWLTAYCILCPPGSF